MHFGMREPEWNSLLDMEKCDDELWDKSGVAARLRIGFYGDGTRRCEHASEGWQALCGTRQEEEVARGLHPEMFSHTSELECLGMVMDDIIRGSAACVTR